MWRSFLPRFPSSGDHRLPVKSIPTSRRNNAEKINESARRCEILIHSRSSPRVAPRPAFLLIEKHIHQCTRYSQPTPKERVQRTASHPARNDGPLCCVCAPSKARVCSHAVQYGTSRAKRLSARRSLPSRRGSCIGRKKAKPPSDSGALPFTVTHCLKNYFPSSMPFCTFSFALI